MIKETTVSWLEIPYITLTFCLRFLKPSEVPEQKVSALRGGLGEMLLRKNCVADRNCDECRFQDSCIVWNAFYTPMRFKPAYMTGKESLGYLIECDNQETDMDPRHGFVFRLKLFGRNIALFSQYLDAFWQLGQAGIGKDHARFEIAAVLSEDESMILDENQIHMENFRIRTVGDYISQRKWELGIGRGCGREEKHVCRINFLTPLALRKERIDLYDFDADAIWRAVHRKIQMMSCFDENPVELEKPLVWPRMLESHIARSGIRRYSNTHKSKAEWKLGSFLVHSKEKTERYKKQDNKKKPDSYHRYLEKMLNSDLFELLEIDGKKVMGIPADQLFEPDEQIRYKLQLMERQIRYANREGRNHG